MTTRKTSPKPTDNGVVPEVALEITDDELQLIHMFCRGVPNVLEPAINKMIAGQLQLKIEQIVQQRQEVPNA